MAAVAVAIVALMGLAACDSEEEPTPSNTSPTENATGPTDDPTTGEPTEEPSQSYRDKRIQAAEEFVIDFYATSAEVGQDGYENWEPRLFPYFTGNEELWEIHSGGYGQDAEAGRSLEGGTEVYSIEATDWEQAPRDAEGFDTVTFRLCLDSRTVVYLNADGTDNTDLVPPDHRYPAEVEVMGQPDAELGWSLMALEPDGGASC